MPHRAKSNRSLLATPRKFTLIELLVVIAIIAILAALLMPALRRARFTAVKAACASGRRQNYLQLALYSNDNDYLLPQTYHDNWSNGAQDAASLASSRPSWQREDNRFALGTLVDAGYVESPELLFCPAFVRIQKTSRPLVRGAVDYQYFDKPDLIRSWKSNRRVPWKDVDERYVNANPDSWQDVFNVPGIQGRMPARVYTGITVYPLAFRDGNGDGDMADRWYGTGEDEVLWGEPGATIQQTADHWNDPLVGGVGHQGTSPMMVSCADYSIGFYRGGHYSDKYDQGWSHDRRGVNGAFFDGSVRWISVSEHGGNFKNSEIHPSEARMQKWARKSMTLTAPQ